MTTTQPDCENGERADLIDTLTKHRSFLRQTVQGLTDSQAAQRTTISELCLGGLIKHVARMEKQWVDFIERGPAAIGSMDQAAMDSARGQFSPVGGGDARRPAG